MAGSRSPARIDVSVGFQVVARPKSLAHKVSVAKVEVEPRPQSRLTLPVTDINPRVEYAHCRPLAKGGVSSLSQVGILPLFSASAACYTDHGVLEAF